MRLSPGEPARRAEVVWILKLALSVALLWYIIDRISLRALWETLAGADPILVALGLAAGAAGLAAGAMQLRLVSERHGIFLSARDALALNLATSFYNLFLLGYLAGGAVRWYRLTRSDATARPVAALAVILYSRFIELTTVLVAGLIFWAADSRARSNHLIPEIFGGILLGLVLVAQLITRPRANAGLLAAARRRFAAIMPARWRDRVDFGLAAAALLRDMPKGTLGRLAGSSTARHLLMIAAFYCFARSLHLPLSLAVAGWTRTVLALAGMLPITVGGLGVREGSLIAVLHPYGIPAPAAAALGLLLFGRELMAAAVGGILEAHALLAPQSEQSPDPR